MNFCFFCRVSGAIFVFTSSYSISDNNVCSRLGGAICFIIFNSCFMMIWVNRCSASFWYSLCYLSASQVINGIVDQNQIAKFQLIERFSKFHPQVIRELTQIIQRSIHI